MKNFTDEEIKHRAFSIYKRKLQAGIPAGSPENNTEINWREAQEELQEIIDLAHDTEIKRYGS